MYTRLSGNSRRHVRWAAPPSDRPPRPSRSRRRAGCPRASSSGRRPCCSANQCTEWNSQTGAPHLSTQFALCTIGVWVPCFGCPTHSLKIGSKLKLDRRRHRGALWLGLPIFVDPLTPELGCRRPINLVMKRVDFADVAARCWQIQDLSAGVALDLNQACT